MASENWAEELQPFLSDIAEFLDLETLVACYGVCSGWQIHMSKDESERIRQRACEAYDEFKDNSWDMNESSRCKAVRYFSRLKLVRNGECFVEEELPARDVNCMYVYRNRIGVGHLQTFEMYKRRGSPPSWRVLFSLAVHDDPACVIKSMKFDNRYLLVVCRTSDNSVPTNTFGTYQTVFKSFDLKSKRQKAIYEGEEDCTLISYDFESKMDIVAGSYSSVGILIWELSTGRLLTKVVTEINIHPSAADPITTEDASLIIKVKLCGGAPKRNAQPPKVQPLKSSDASGSSDRTSKLSSQTTLGRQEGTGRLLLFGVGIKHLIGWEVYDLHLRERAINVEAKPDLCCGLSLKQFHGIISSSLLRRGDNLCFPQASPCGQSELFCDLDMKGSESTTPYTVTIPQKATDKIKNLLAVGEKYIAFHTAGENGIGEQVHVMEMLPCRGMVWFTGELITRYELPQLRNIVQGVEQDRVYFCDQNFLNDGFDLDREGKLFLAYQNAGRVRLVYWNSWKDIVKRAIVVRQSP